MNEKVSSLDTLKKQIVFVYLFIFIARQNTQHRNDKTMGTRKERRQSKQKQNMYMTTVTTAATKLLNLVCVYVLVYMHVYIHPSHVVREGGCLLDR